jgi:hypothetical protein
MMNFEGSNRGFFEVRNKIFEVLANLEGLGGGRRVRVREWVAILSYP